MTQSCAHMYLQTLINFAAKFFVLGAFVLVPCDFITNFFSSKFLKRWRNRSETMCHEAENVTLRYYLSFYRVLKKVLEHKYKGNPC